LTRRYIVYLAAPLALATLVAFQWGLALAKGPRPELAFAARAPGREVQLISDSARAGLGARLSPKPFAEILARPGLAFWDEPIAASRPGLPSGGSPYFELEGLKDAAWLGSSVVFGYRSLSETEQAPARADLAETCALDLGDWIGSYVSGLGRKGSVPARARAAWEERSGRRWDFSGDGLLLWNRAEGRVLVLRRGVELGPRSVSVRGTAAPSPGAAGADGCFVGWFRITRQRADASVAAEIEIDLLAPGRAILAGSGVPESFPALTWRPYGAGRVWAMTGDFAGPGTSSEFIGPLPAPQLQKARTLDAPGNSIGVFQRILVPLVSGIAAAALSPSAAAAPRPMPAAARTRAPLGSSYLVRAPARAGEPESGGAPAWKPWFVRGVDLGASAPGWAATEPRPDDGYWLDTLRDISAAGFDSVRIYTLLPPAFYRALARFNAGAPKPLLLFQGIWLDEEPPGGDLLDEKWLAGEMEESDRCLDAVHGAASIAPRSGKSWGEYRVDASPWLAAVLVGRELLPEEVGATAAAHPEYRWSGRFFAAAPRRPVESFLARWADRVKSRESQRYGREYPIGFVSWPTLDPLHHPGEWDQGSAVAPYHDCRTLDLRAISSGPDESSGFFAAFHIYPNYPDFMTRDSRYESEDPTGMERYGAYLTDLASVLPKVPLIVAEFGLATGYGSAHAHPEGLDHGGLSEAAQARGLARLFRTIERRGAGGGMVFEWADEWAKKTWTTEGFMIPYDRHQLWHNVIDPEQNYGIMGWKLSAPPSWADSRMGLRSACDEEFLYVEIDAGRGSPWKRRIVELGLDLVPGATGQRRLFEGGPRSSQGSEFKVRVDLEGDRLIAARLLVAADYDRASGRLFPGESEGAYFAELSNLINREATTEEGIHYEALYEKGSSLPSIPADDEALARVVGPGLIELRLPWSRLNVSDPSSGRLLLDRRDARTIVEHDAIGTISIDSAGLWATVRPYEPDGAGVSRSIGPWRAPLRRWNSVAVEPRPKAAVAVLKGLLDSWRTPGAGDGAR